MDLLAFYPYKIKTLHTIQHEHEIFHIYFTCLCQFAALFILCRVTIGEPINVGPVFTIKTLPTSFNFIYFKNTKTNLPHYLLISYYTTSKARKVDSLLSVFEDTIKVYLCCRNVELVIDVGNVYLHLHGLIPWFYSQRKTCYL